MVGKSKRLRLYNKPAPSPEELPVWTTWQLSDYLDINVATVQRWCKKWFGDLGKGFNVGPGQGYPIPWQYVYVARAYLQIEDDRLRREIRRALLLTPRDFVAVVDGSATTHYSFQEAAERAATLKRFACIVYVGEFKERINKVGTSPR